MSDLPKIAAKRPAFADLEEGKTYMYCTCGLSENQPFCDGKHRGTGYAPQVFVAKETRSCMLCQCKRTGDAPYCDGKHGKL